MVGSEFSKGATTIGVGAGVAAGEGFAVALATGATGVAGLLSAATAVVLPGFGGKDGCSGLATLGVDTLAGVVGTGLAIGTGLAGGAALVAGVVACVGAVAVDADVVAAFDAANRARA